MQPRACVQVQMQPFDGLITLTRNYHHHTMDVCVCVCVCAEISGIEVNYATNGHHRCRCCGCCCI